MSILISVSTQLKASAAEAWAALENIESHVLWMKDAESIQFTTPERTGNWDEVHLHHEGGPHPADRRDVHHGVEAL